MLCSSLVIWIYPIQGNACFQLSDVTTNWNIAFKECSEQNGRLYAPRYLVEWQETLRGLNGGVNPSDSEVFWTGNHFCVLFDSQK